MTIFDQQHRSILCSTLFVLAFLAGCGGGGGSSDPAPSTGTLTVGVTDAPVSDVDQVVVQFSGVTVKPREGEQITIEFDEANSIDLLALDGPQTETLLDGEEMDAGEYNWIQLEVNAVEGTEDSFVRTDTGQQIELEVPSGGLRLVSGFTITANQETSFVIDWDVRRGLTAPANQDSWKLTPALRIIDSTEFGDIAGTVAVELVEDESCTNDLAEETGNAVYIYEGLDITPVDIDQSDNDPVATGDVTQDENGNYTYSVTFLSPGDYTVAFTCQANDDEPDVEDDIAFAGSANATVEDGEETTVDFE